MTVAASRSGLATSSFTNACSRPTSPALVCIAGKMSIAFLMIGQFASLGIESAAVGGVTTTTSGAAGRPGAGRLLLMLLLLLLLLLLPPPKPPLRSTDCGAAAL